MDKNSPAIELSKVNKWFGVFQVLKDIDLIVDQGEKIVICGPSGSGKSTLVRCVNRLEEHQSGTIKVLGKVLTKSNIPTLRNVGMVFQQFNLFPHLTVLQNLTLGPVKALGMSIKNANKRAYSLLERVKIPEQAQKRPNELSGGQQQRVAIARSLCMNPEIMLFDDRILNVKKWKEVHPGSKALIVKHLGEDISKRFRFIKHSEISWAELYALQIGYLL